jgi:hypothetical protein
MEDIKRLSREGVPTLKKVWIHNNDVIGIDEDGEPVIIATLEENEEGQARPVRKRPPRKRREQDEPKVPPEE